MKTSPAKSKKSITPRSRIRAALRQCWLRGRERAAAIQRDKYTCQICGVKQRMENKEYVVKVQVHHKKGILDWNKLINAVLASGLFTGPENLTTVCKKCHAEIKEVNHE